MTLKIIDFLTNFYFFILYGITLFFALFNYRKYFDSILKYFPILIAYTLLTEILGYYILRDESFQIIYLEEYSINNSLVYNIFDIIFFLYFFYIYWNEVENTKNKKIIKYGAFAFIGVSLINPFLQNFWLFPQIYAIITGSAVLVLSIFLYLKELKNRARKVPNKKNLLFWVSLGILAFYPLYPAIIIIGLYYNKIYSTFFSPLHHAFIAIMYLCFIIGFLKMQRMKPIEEEK